MAMKTQALSVGTWYQFVELDNPEFIQFYLDSSDEVIAAIEAAEPTSSSPGYFCVQGMNTFTIPLGKSLWVKLTSGSADVIYSQFGGVLIDEEKCAWAKTDAIAVDEVETGIPSRAGFDDSATDTLTYVGLLHTAAAGLASAATIDSAVMTLVFSQFKNGRTIRLYGIEDDTSITSALTDYNSLAVDPPLTTAFVDVTLDNSGSATIDLTSVIQELVDDVTGWTTSSPVQLQIVDTGSTPTSGNDETAVLFIQGRASALYVRAS